MRISSDRLIAATAAILSKAGCEDSIAGEVADQLVEADLRNHKSHGVRQLPNYLNRLTIGGVQGTQRPVITLEQGSLIRLDGRRAFGQIVGASSAREGIRLAGQHGIGVVAAVNGGHLGRNGHWAELAADQGIASMHFISSPENDSTVAPFGGRLPRLVSSPIALGAPHPDGDHVVLDFSIGEMSLGAVHYAYERGEHLAEACLVNFDGSPTDDPASYFGPDGRKSSLRPFGGYKGYGLGLMADIFAGALTGAGSHLRDNPEPRDYTNAMLSIYLDPTAFAAAGFFAHQISSFCDWVRSSPAVDPGAPVTLPGERGRKARAEQLREGVGMDPSMAGALVQAAHSVDAFELLRKALPELFADRNPQNGPDTTPRTSGFPVAQPVRKREP